MTVVHIAVAASGGLRFIISDLSYLDPLYRIPDPWEHWFRYHITHRWMDGSGSTQQAYRESRCCQAAAFGLSYGRLRWSPAMPPGLEEKRWAVVEETHSPPALALSLLQRMEGSDFPKLF
ncbi:hypothetical protein SRHO_G00158500 [Serrasalmus rhombeus]